MLAVVVGEAGADPLWERKTLLGDMGGLRRPGLANYGAVLSLVETSEMLGNVTGGRHRGFIHEGLADLSLAVDLRTRLDWPATIFVRGYQIRGRGLTVNNLLNLHTTSGIEATRTTRLFELWYEQSVGDWLRLRIGQQSAGQEFLISTTAQLFMNGAFGWPTLPSISLPSGGPGYPLGTPAVRLRIDASEELAVFAGVFNGNPAGPGMGDPQRRDASGTAFRVNDGALLLVEARYNPGNVVDNVTYRLGAWFHTEQFADPHRDATGLSLADPGSTGVPRHHRRNFSPYAIIDQPLFRKAGEDGGLAVFLRAMAAPQDRNVVDLYVDGGVIYKGPFGRPDDTLGLAIAYTRIGKSARALDADFATLNTYPIRSGEALLEVT